MSSEGSLIAAQAAAPAAALSPLGQASRRYLPVAAAAAATLFPVTINALRGLKSVDPDALDLMRSYAATEQETYRKLRVPNAMPYLFTALKLSASASVIGAIVGELPVGSTEGLGSALINGAQYNTFQPAYLWATIIAAAALGLMFDGLVALVDRRVV